ncbi:MAG: hypothetical protein ABI811_12640 [Acidobacteriota bacterium]
MKILIRVHGIELTDELNEDVERSIAFAVDRFAPIMQDVLLYIVDLNGPKGGVDKLCHITATPISGDRVLILERGTEVLDTVQRAARSLKHRLGKDVQRRNRPPARKFRESIRTI